MEAVGSKLSDAEGDYADIEVKLQQIEQFVKKAQEKKRQAQEAELASKEKNGHMQNDAVKVLYDILHINRKSTRLNSSHANISYAVFCLKKKK